MTSLMPRATLFPDLFRFFDGGWPFSDHHTVRIEDYQANGDYVVRAELPGINPENDITITVEGNHLSIKAERTAEKHEKTHSEFSYGSFERTVHLPGTAATDKVSARYEAGVLEVTVPLTKLTGSRKIPVTIAKNKKE